MIKEENLRKIGQFAKPHGVKGEISLLTDVELSDIVGDPYIVCDMDGLWVPFFIDSYRQKSASATLVTFEHLDSDEKVKILTGKTAFISSELLPADEEHPAHEENRVGYTLIDEQVGTLGKVIMVDDSTPNILLLVDYKGIEILVPLALVTSVRHEQKTMSVSLPEGFLEI